MEAPLSQAYGLPAPLSGEPNETSPLGEGNRRQTVEGFLWNLLHSVKDLRSYPSVTCGDSSPKGEPMHQKGAY